MNPTQSTLWMKRLAVTVTGGTFCICAYAADINLSIEPAVHIRWATTTNKAYQVEVSTNLPGNWTATGQLIEGTGAQVSTFLTATNGQQFFRVQETTASGLSWLHGTWNGPACQAGPGIPLLSFMASAVADATNRVFTLAASSFSGGGGSCTWTLALLSYSDSEAQFHETPQSGSCFPGTVVFTRINPTNIAYHFFSTNPAGTGGGLLIKQ